MKKGLFLFFLFTISYSLAQNSKHQVIVLGIDGLNNYRLDEAYTPHFDYLKQHASWTLYAQANEPLSSSPNWKSIITGTTPDKHLITENGFSRKVYKNNPTCEGEPKKFPTIFTMIKRDNPKAKLGLFEHWGAFWRLVKGDKLNRKFWWEFKPKPSVKRAMAFYKKRDATLSFIQIDQCDHAGHKYGHESAEYVKAVEQADELLGIVLKTINEKDNFKNTTLIVVADHGGKGNSHGAGTPEGMNIPLFIMGSNIKAGYEINNTTVKNEDVAVMVLKALGIKPHKCWTAKYIDEIYLSN